MRNRAEMGHAAGRAGWDSCLNKGKELSGAGVWPAFLQVGAACVDERLSNLQVSYLDGSPGLRQRKANDVFTRGKPGKRCRDGRSTPAAQCRTVS